MTAAAAQEHAEEPLVIRPAPRWVGLGLRELWAYRGLFYFLTWRDLKLRYKQTVVGAGWAILQPFFVMIVFSIFFGRVAKISSEGVPYPIFSYAALIPWMFFANSIGFAANSVVSSASLITKVYFPRLLVTLAPLMSYLVDYALAFSILIGMMFYYGIYPDPVHVWLVLPLTVLVAAVAMGVGLWLAALNVRYRDIRFVVPFVLQIWMFATPIVYGAGAVGSKWRIVYGLNPMVGVIEGFRWSLIGVGSPSAGAVGLSVAVAVVLLISGGYYFRKVERHFADVV